MGINGSDSGHILLGREDEFMVYHIIREVPQAVKRACGV